MIASILMVTHIYCISVSIRMVVTQCSHQYFYIATPIPGPANIVLISTDISCLLPPPLAAKFSNL